MPPNSVIKADLEYVSKFWNETDGYDLWEESMGKHLFTASVQLRALREGAELAGALATRAQGNGTRGRLLDWRTC